MYWYGNPIQTSLIVWGSGADPGFRRGGGSYIQKGGGFVQEFQERIQIVAGSWANQQAKKIADSRRGGGGFGSPQKTPVSAHGDRQSRQANCMGTGSPDMRDMRLAFCIRIWKRTPLIVEDWLIPKTKRSN